VNALVADNNNSTSPNFNPDGNKRLYEDDIADQLLHVSTGHHYLYPDIETMRKVYASYIKSQLKEQPNSVVLFILIILIIITYCTYNMLIRASKSFSHKFIHPGEFSYFCRVHPTMVG
jgi:hypothetical protein